MDKTINKKLFSKNINLKFYLFHAFILRLLLKIFLLNLNKLKTNNN